MNLHHLDKQVKVVISQWTFLDVFIAALLLIGGTIFFLLFFRRSEFVNIRVKVTDKEVLYAQNRPQNWYANQFQVGDSEQDGLGRKITEVVGVETFNVDANTKATYVDLRVRATYDTRTKLYSARGKSLIFGQPMRFYLSKVIFDGIITQFPGSTYQKELKVAKAKIGVLARAVEPSIAEAIVRGEEIHDSNGVLLAKVESIQVRSAERVTQTDRGDLLLRFDPLYRDVILTLTVQTKTYKGETYVFDNLPLKIGEKLPLNFEKVSIFPIITDFTLQ